MSRKAKTRSDSKSLKEGISPDELDVSQEQGRVQSAVGRASNL